MEKPDLRFDGFNDVWQKYTFGDILSVNSGKDYKCCGKGNIPVYGTGGYMLSIDKSLSSKDAIGIGRKGTIDNPQYLKAPFWTIDTLFYLTLKKDFDLSFIFYLTNNIKWRKLDESTGVPSLSKGNIERISQHIPCLAEQKMISNFFKSFDLKKGEIEKEIKCLKQIKQACLQSMFPQEGESVPKVRFKDFQDVWSSTTLNDVSTIKKGDQVNKTELCATGKYYVLNGGINPSGFVNEYNTEGNTISISEGGNSCGYVHFNRTKFWSGGHNYTLQLVKFDTKFLYAYLKAKEQYIMSMRVGSGLPNIQKKNLSELVIHYPPNILEQQKIGLYFESLDNQINLQTQRLEKLLHIKSACLDKMFV